MFSSLSKKLVVALSLGLVLVTGAANAQSNRELQRDLNEVLRQLRVVQQRLIEHLDQGGDTATGAGASGAAGFSEADRGVLADIEVRLGAIDRELRQLTGTIEEVQHKQNLLERNFESFKADVDMRFGDLTASGGALQGGGAARGGEPRFVTDEAPVTGGLTPTLTPEAAQQAVEAYEQQRAEMEQMPATEVTALADDTAILPEGSVEERYDAAFGYMRRGDYAGAEAAFLEFLENHSGEALAGNAQYWLGESYYARKDYANAAAAFLTGYQNYADGTKAPDNLLKLGMSLAALGQVEDACVVFSDIAPRYPSANPGVHEAAQRESDRLGCS